jgi:hypothetical protein
MKWLVLKHGVVSTLLGKESTSLVKVVNLIRMDKQLLLYSLNGNEHVFCNRNRNRLALVAAAHYAGIPSVNELCFL